MREPIIHYEKTALVYGKGEKQGCFHEWKQLNYENSQFWWERLFRSNHAIIIKL